jgi:hypothetical protein
VKRRRLLLIIGLALAALMAWRLWPSREEAARTHIESRAREEIVAACNAAAEAAGLGVRFDVADVAAPARDVVETRSGVALLASVLRARREGTTCAWDGIEAATLTRE